MNRFTEQEVEFLNKVKEKTIGSCQDCENGWATDGEFSIECDCRKVFIFLKELVYARIPQEYWSLGIEDLELGSRLTKIEAKKYFKHFDAALERGLGFCMMGANGVGKTSLLAEIGKLSVIKGVSVVYMTTQDYINYKMLNDYDNLRRIEEDSDVILLDEIDKPYRKKGSDYVLSQVENFMRSILPKNKTLHVATNWTKEEVKSYFGDSVFSIMMRKLKFISITGEDKSEDLQNEWDKRLNGGEVNYLSKYFVGKANEMKRFLE